MWAYGHTYMGAGRGEVYFHLRGVSAFLMCVPWHIELIGMGMQRTWCVELIDFVEVGITGCWHRSRGAVRLC